ncbi:raftlin-2 isoform X3 [Microcaecilia unicolor]|uniref:Raftlin-2 isoform X3 n=1 Tax=Microcaecilia unicolor TaxID=1415580 RepID=A0A6P7YQR7_9AMPH|nr:raftlin-2 isoform X3 [Microcaecilia unicolor]
MGCGLRKLDDPDDSSPGKIFSTLKRPQVETKTDYTYEYLLLDFSLEVPSSPDVIKISSFLDIAKKVEEYYRKGYVVGVVHPIILSTGRRRHLPVSYLYRVVLYRLKLSQKHTVPRGQRHPRLVIEEWPLMCEALTNELVKGLLEKVNEASRRGMKFVGFVMRPHPHSKPCNSTNTFTAGDKDMETTKRSQEHSSQKTDENSTNWAEETLHSSLSRAEGESQQETGHLQDTAFQFAREGSPLKLRKSEGDHLLKSLEGLFIYEDEGSGVPGSNRKGNDAIVVEQWTVIEGCEIKTDYGPLLHALAEFGWLLTCVLPTPIIRQDREGNLATKQVIFLQRPVIINSASQTPEKRSARHIGSEERNRASSRSIGLHTTTPRTPERVHPSSDEFRLSPSKQCWAKEGPLQYGNFSGFSSSDSMLKDLDDGQFEQEDGVTQVTCM